MNTNSLVAISIIVVYFILNAIIIKLLSRKQDSLEEFGVGSRSFGWLLNCFSYIGGWYTGSIYIGWVSNSASYGIYSQYVIIYSVASLFIMFFMARPVWVLGKVHNLVTQADLIELRYKSKKFKFLFSLLTFLFWAPWLIIEVKAIGYVVQAATYKAVPLTVGLIIVSAFVIAYSFLGGARASAVGGLVQGITFTVVGVLAVYWLIVKTYGGVGFDNLYDIVAHDGFDILGGVLPSSFLMSPTTGTVNYNFWFSIVLTCTVAGYMLPGVFASIYRADSSRAVKKSVTVAPIAGIAIGFTVLSLAMGLQKFGDFPADPQETSFWIADKFGGPVMLGLMGVLALAACMSTISAVLATASVLLSKDIVGTFAPQLDRQKLFKIARIMTIGVGIVAIGIACMNIPNLMNVALLMYDCSVQAFPAIFIGLFWKKANLPGVFTGFVVGCIISLIGTVFFFTGNSLLGGIPLPTVMPDAWGPLAGFSFGTLGFFANIIIIVICGLTMRKDKDVDAIFDTVKNYKEVYSKKAI
jgi:SSS family solute:Na+ symporter